MGNSRKDKKGRVLRKGESQRTEDNRYMYTYTDPFGRRKRVYATDLQSLRKGRSIKKRSVRWIGCLCGRECYTQ